ncbi:MAG: hypothetical protein QME21_14320 [Anaerolineales bacterium]|nr:hypothetical protein [Anaerolineales bacterium]
MVDISPVMNFLDKAVSAAEHAHYTPRDGFPEPVEALPVWAIGGGGFPADTAG